MASCSICIRARHLPVTTVTIDTLRRRKFAMSRTRRSHFKRRDHKREFSNTGAAMSCAADLRVRQEWIRNALLRSLVSHIIPAPCGRKFEEVNPGQLI